jgi:putative DNA primase/helicase
MILEYRSNGNLTVFPPSIHKSGAKIEFISANDTAPAVISRSELLEACAKPIAFTLPKGVEQNTDLGAAHFFKNFASDKAIYCPERRSWYAWDGKRWAPDHLGKITRLAYEMATKLSEQGNRESNVGLQQVGVKLQSQQHLKNMLKIAENIIAISASAFDTEPDLLTCDNGTLDLRVGKLIDFDPSHHLTQLAPVSFNKNTQCPQFLKFLDEIFASDAELIAYIQRLCGYVLTGHTKEQGFYICYGSGRNGKSTFTSTIQEIIGDFASIINPEALLKSNKDHQHDIAELQGKRLVLAQEIDAGRKLNEGLIKQLTGGDVIVGRQKYEKNIRFIPTCKILLSVNHKPEIKGDDTGIWRRVNLIPFTVSIPPEQVDKDLPQKLLAEKEGIFRWMVEGAVQWYAKGLQVPKAVTAANAEYRSDMDTVGRFLEQCCELEEDAFVEVSKLFDEYECWAVIEGADTVSKQEFGRKLNGRGLSSSTKKVEGCTVRVRLGLKLLTDYSKSSF